jgi:hypothetical protein
VHLEDALGEVDGNRRGFHNFLLKGMSQRKRYSGLTPSSGCLRV